MRIMSVDDVGLELLDDPRELPGRVQIDLGPRREPNQVVTFGGPPGELTVGMRDEQRPMSALPHPQDGEENLALSAAPRSCRVHVY